MSRAVTDRDQPGLRMRLAHEARRIAGQHAYLAALEATTRVALETGDGAAVARALDVFAGSLEAHFSLEEHVQFPALHGLHPENERDLAELVADHVRFRSALEALQALAAGPDPTARRAEAVAAFGRLTDDLGGHEAREEVLLARAPER
jgi:iron-sulfur cluster repair protein YtfE (RIC family)